MDSQQLVTRIFKLNVPGHIKFESYTAFGNFFHPRTTAMTSPRTVMRKAFFAVQVARFALQSFGIPCLLELDDKLPQSPEHSNDFPNDHLASSVSGDRRAQPITFWLCIA